MLEGLDAVDWTALTHAYGPASDVPAMLRDLIGRDVKTRTRARTLLYGSILHQGTVYEATSAAVPFFLELLTAEDMPDRVWLFGFLATVAKETEFIYDPPPSSGGNPVQEARIEHGRAVARQAREAVRVGMPLYLELLAHPQQAIREAAIRPLAALREDAMESAMALHERLAVEESAAIRKRITACLNKLSRWEV